MLETRALTSLRIFLGEADRADGAPLYEALVIKAREMHLAGATVLRGPLGFGHASRLHTSKILRLSHDLPMIVEIIDERDKLVGFLALFANLAMLCGLFGTIVGLIKAFGAVGGESVDPSQKARILAEGISEAMNCTAFGLLAAITALVGFAFLNGKTQGMEDDINEASVRVLNLVVANRQKVNLQGLEGAQY